MQYLEFVASLLTILNIFYIGKKIWWGWLLGIGSAMLWVIFSIFTGYYWLGLLNLTIFALALNNLIQWKKQERDGE